MCVFAHTNIRLAFSFDVMVSVYLAVRAIFPVLGSLLTCLVHPFSDQFPMFWTVNQRSWCSFASLQVVSQVVKFFSSGSHNLQVGLSMLLFLGYSCAAANGCRRGLDCIHDQSLFLSVFLEQYIFQHRHLVRQAVCVCFVGWLIRSPLAAYIPILR